MTPTPPGPCDGVDATKRSVAVHESDLWLCAPGESARQLTRSGDVQAASLSPDGRRVAFSRHHGTVATRVGAIGFEPASPQDDGASVIPDDRIYLLELASADALEADAGAAPLAVEVAKNGVCMSLGAPDFVFDDGLLVPAYGYHGGTVHNRFVCFVDLKTKRTVMLGKRTTCGIAIRTGRFKGAIFVPRADFKVGQGLIDDLVVVDRRGAVLKSFDGHPFQVDLDGDGAVAQDEGFCPTEAYRAGIDRLTAKW